MKASARQQRLLLELQELDTFLARARHRAKNLAEREALATLDKSYEPLRADVLGKHRELDSLQLDLERLEDDVRLVDERRARDEKLLESSSSTKEINALQNEMQALAVRKGELEEKQLALMETEEQAKSEHAGATESLRKVEAEREELVRALEEKEGEIAADVARVTDERRLLSAELQQDLLALYERTREKTGIGAARLRGNVSEGSNMALTPADLGAIRATPEDEIVFCPGSGAILVRIDEE